MKRREERKQAQWRRQKVVRERAMKVKKVEKERRTLVWMKDESVGEGEEWQQCLWEERK